MHRPCNEKLKKDFHQTQINDFLTGLNNEQRKAVLHREGPMLVTAGPGSGKTHVITTRLLHMIFEYKIPPEKILVITFTKEAAKSMQNRFLTKYDEILQKQTGDSIHQKDVSNNQINKDSIYEASAVFGTFHSVYYQIIRSIPKYSQCHLIHEKEKKYILSQAIKKSKDYEFPENTEDFIDDMIYAISYYKNTEDLEMASKKAKIPEFKFRDILNRYDAEMNKRKTLDFDDMLYLCLKEFQRDKILLEKWQERFEYYLVDEFQDCNPIQYKILKMLACKNKKNSANIFVVGDDDQAIYGFRGAESMILQKFLQDFSDADNVTLSINYRCTEAIVKASARVINENHFRMKKEFIANKDNNSDEKVSICKWTGKDEMFKALRDYLKKVPKEELSNHAVLFRTNQETQMFAVELMKDNIPFQIKDKGLCIYEHFLVKDIMAFLQAANGNRERKLFLRILNKPRRNICREALEDETVDFQKIKSFYSNKWMQDTAALQDAIRLEQQLKQLRNMSVSLGIRYIRNAMQYEKYLTKRAAGNVGLLESWMELLDWLQEDASSFVDLREWEEYQKEYISQQQKMKNNKSANDKYNDIYQNSANTEKGNKISEKIHLMTMHASKGLEFEHCYILNVNEGMIPKYQKGQKLTGEELEEERRIFYVGMTRAKKTLELHYQTGTKERPKFPSRFIQKLIDEHF